MENYEYPKEVTEKNFQELVGRAQKIRKREWDLDFIAVFVTVAIMAAILVSILWYFSGYLKNFTDPRLFSITIVLLSIGASLFASTYVAEGARLFLRRLNFFINHFPTREESIFAECFIILNRLDKNRIYAESWRHRFQGATWRTGLLCDEFSLYAKDLFNLKRRFYAPEFRLLASGTNQINRMLLFSGSVVNGLLSRFALAFVNNEDVIAHRCLKEILSEVEKYGNLENWSLRLENQLKSPTGIASLIAGTIAFIGGLLALIAAILG